MKRVAFIAGIVLLLATSAFASELRFTFVNPSFGGNPLNGQWLLNNASAQNDFQADFEMPDISEILDQINELVIENNVQIGNDNQQ